MARTPTTPGAGRPITREEINDVLADEGYSADERKTWLKDVLTDLTAHRPETPDPDRDELIEEVRRIIDAHQNGDTLADDVL